MEEFERLEGELKSLFDQYFIRVRCLDALKMQVALRVKMPTQVQLPITKSSETSMTFLPDGLIDSDEELNDDEDDDLKIRNETRKLREQTNGAEPRAATRLRVRTAGKILTLQNVSNIMYIFLLIYLRIVTRGDRRFVGNMMGGGSDLDSSLDSEDSDSDLDIADDLRSDDDETIAKLTGEVTNKTKPTNNDHSDEDF